MIRRGTDAGAELAIFTPVVAWAAVACGLVFLLIVVPALWGDWWRCRKQRPVGPRCPKCWYNMSGVTGLRCPECGREAKSAAALLKNRRRWLGGAISLFPLAGAVVCAVALFMGVTAFAARWVPDWELAEELYGQGSTKGKEWHAFCMRVMYERYQWRLPASVRTPALKAAGVVAVPGKVTTRAVWPSGSMVQIRLEPVLPGGNTPLWGTRTTVTFDQRGLDAAGSRAPGEWDLSGIMLLEIGKPADGSYTLPYVLTLRDDSGAVLMTTRASVAFTVGGGAVLKNEKDPWLEKWAAAELEKRATYKASDRVLRMVVIRVDDGTEKMEGLASLEGHPIPVFPPAFRVRVERGGVTVAKGIGLVTVVAASPTNYTMLFGGNSLTTLVWEEGEEENGLMGCDLVLEADEQAALASPGVTTFTPLVLRMRMERVVQNKLSRWEGGED
ncbi:MAG: hypothetical protein QM783_08535 [Phycisphaerales bacterium]